MKLTQTLSVVYCMIRVVWCVDFSVTLPETVKAVSGHCVLIPCQFDVESKYEVYLKNTPVGKWHKDGTEFSNIVFDSSTPENNQIKGNITGDLSEKNCTTVFTSISPDFSGSYYFRIEEKENLKYTYKNPHVSINVSDSPPEPTLSLNVDQKEVKDLENVMEGSSVNLICSALAPCPSNPPTLTWTNVPSNISVQEIQNTTFISSHLNFTASHLHDEKKITCSASYQLEDKTIKSVSSSRLLRVLYPPRNTSVSAVPPGPVLLGSSVFLNCSSDGNPAVLNFTWYRENGEQIGTGNTLNITETNHTHSGLYYCRAQNTHGTHNSSVLLDLQYPPRNTSVSVVPLGPVLLGNSVSLICSSDGNPAVLNFTWYRENGEQIGTGDTLNITQTNHTHSGLYYCRAQNTHGIHNSSVLLDLQYPPRNISVTAVPPGPVLLGSSVSLICRSDGNPAVLNFTWYRENGEQIGTGDTLNITETNHTHSGLYYCRAQNTHGIHNSSVQLDVHYPPRNMSVSAVPPGPVMLGSSVSLICSSDGNPAVLNFTWYRENREQIGTGDTLNITETNHTHSGLYYCSAQNTHGTHNSSVQLDVHFSPQASLSSHCNSSDGGILCVCEVHGFPVPKLEWLLSGSSVPPSVNQSIREEPVGSVGLRSIITIGPGATDKPTLQCIGSNNLGSTNQQFYPVTLYLSAPDFFHMSSVLFGAAVGASAVMLLCIIYVCGRRKHHKPSQEENAGLVLNDRAVYQDEEEESLYANKSSKRAPNRRDPDILHYSTIFFPGEDGSGEIRGLSSLTSEYSTVKHSHGEQGEEEITVTEMEPPLAEEVTYGNIVRHKTSHSDVDADVKLEQPETRKTEPERSTHSVEEEGLYAEVKHKAHKEKA